MKEIPNRILLIDDDKINNLLNERLLKKLGHFETITIFMDGESALTYLKQELEKGNDSPELMFMDINMPVMNGFEFLEHYRKLNFRNKEDVNIIGVTTSLRDSDMEKMKELNCTHILNKPLTRDLVNNLLEKLYVLSRSMS